MMSIIALFLSAWATSAAPLTGDESRGLRRAVYGSKALLYVPKELLGGVAGPEVVTVPAAVAALPGRKPRAVIEVLLKVAEGGRPGDSARAAAYALALTDGPAVGALPIRHFNEDTYDDPDTARINSRATWVSSVRKKLAAFDRVAVASAPKR